MKDIWNEQFKWVKSGDPFTIARVIRTWRSAPRKTGSGMLIGKRIKKDSLPKVVGSVSGGCIEAAVIEEALNVLETGESRQIDYGIEDDLALTVGLSCGGEISILVEKHWAFSDDKDTKKVWKTLKKNVSNNEPAILFTSLSSKKISKNINPQHFLALPNKNLDIPYRFVGNLPSSEKELITLTKDIYTKRENKIINICSDEFFVQIFPRRDQLLIIGAGHITIPLVRFAKELDFLTVVIDPRTVFSNSDRFPVAPDHLIPKWPDQILEEWPLNEDTYAILLTHDPKIDDPALHILLKKNLAYIGALGSSKTHAKRCKRLNEAGIDNKSISRIISPAGVDIGGQTAAEIALSMIAEVIASKYRKHEQ